MNVNGFNLQVGVYANTDPATIEIKKFLADAKKTSDLKLDIKFNSQGRQAVNQVKTATGDLVTITKQYNKQGQLVDVTVNKLSRDYKNLTSATQQAKNAQQQLNAEAKKSKTIFSDFTDTFMKMAKFNTINLIYDGIINSITKAIEVTEKFNAATIELQKVSDLSGESLSKYTQYLGELGAEVARTTSEMISGATEWKKSGFSEEESAQLAKLTAQFQNIADEELEASEAANILISVMKGFKLSTQDVEHIEDSINSVSNSFAVSSSDISQGLGNVAAVSQTAGNSLEETIGMLTAMVEISRNASKSSRGLIQITTRLSQTLDDTSATGNKLREIYKELGISLEDSKGQLRSSYDILKDLSKVWNNLSTDQQKYIALTSSGANQINNFTALMSNFSTAIEATETALNSAGSAAQENAKYMEGIAAQLTAIQAQIERLILGDGGLEKFLTTTLKLSNGLLTLINNLGGLQSIFTIIGTVSLIAIIQNFDKLLTLSKTMGDNLIKPFKTLASYIKTTFNTYVETSINNMMGLATAEEIAAANAAMLQLALSAVVAIIGVATLAYQNYKQAQEESQQNAVNAAHNYETEQKSLKEVITQLNNESNTRSQLASIIKQQLGDAYSSEIDNLKDVNELRQKGIELIYAEARAKAEEVQRTTGAQYTQAQEDLSKNQFTQIGAGAETRHYSGNAEERYEAIGKQIDAYNEKIKQNIKLSHDEQWTLNALTEEYTNLGNEIEQNKTIVNTYDDATKLLNGTFESYMESLVNTAKETEDFQEVLDKFGYETVEDLEKALIEAGGSEEDFNNALLAGEDALDEYANGLLKVQNNANESKDAFSEFISNAVDMQSAYETLTKAANEYNKNGIISASTLKALAKLQPEYVAQLEVVNGKMQVGNGLLQEEFAYEKQLALISVETAKQLRIQALCQEYSNTETNKAKTAVTEAEPKVQELANALNNMGIEGMNAARGVIAVKKSLADDEEKSAEFDKKLADIEDWANGMKDSINAVNLGAVESSKSAASSSKDAWVEAFKEEQRLLKHSLEMNEITEYEYYEKLKALNEKYFGEISGKHDKYLKEYQENEEEIYKGLKSIYDKVRDYLAEAVEKGYEKAIKALQKEEKKLIDGIKKSIDALKKEKQQTLDNIKDEINALKKQKENAQKYWNDQIDSIKKENDVLQEQNELLQYQQALQQAKAQKVMVFQGGKFQLGENESAVAQAEQNLSQYQDQLSYEQQIEQLENLRDAQVESIEARIESLEEYYDYMEDYYDKQIEAMEEYRDKVQEEYDARVEALQAELDAFKEGLQQEKDIEDERLYNQALGMEERANIYKQELTNLKSYINQANAMLTQLGNAGAQVDFAFEPLTKSRSLGTKSSSNVQVAARASGDASFKGNEIALVGESPNTELVLGSRINQSVNSGTLMNLAKGSGVVNAESTSTLAGLLNTLSTPSIANNNRTTQQNFNFGSISLPNVTNADTFVNTLSNKFNNYALQYGNTHK